MKPIISIEVDLKNVKGAVSSLSDLSLKAQDVRGELMALNSPLDVFAKTSTKTMDKVGDSIKKIQGATKGLDTAFKKVGNTIKSIAQNALGRFLTLLKTTALALGGIAGMVTGAFMGARGTTSTAMQGAMQGLSYAQQRGLEAANKESGFNADFGTHKGTFNDGQKMLEYKALFSGLVPNIDLDKLKNDPTSYYKMNEALYQKYLDIKSKSDSVDMANVEFESLFGNALSDFGFGDLNNFLSANESGAMKKHQEIFNATSTKYKSVDVNALMQGERALNNFLDSLKGFALNIASKVLPTLTKGLNGVTKLFDSLMNFASKSGLIDSIGNALKNFVDMLVTIGDKILEVFSALTGSSASELVMDTINGASNAFKGVTAWLKGDTETRDKAAQNLWDTNKKWQDKGAKAISGIAGKGAEMINNIFGTSLDSEGIKDSVKSGMDSAHSWVNEKVENNFSSLKTIEKEKETRSFTDNRPKALAGATTTNVYVDGAKVAEVRQQAVENPITNVIEFGKAQVVK